MTDVYINVLIADDNENFLITFYNYLANKDNIRIIQVTEDGKTTLDKIIELRPDVVILDLNMPKMNGIEVIKKLTVLQGKIPSIIVFAGDPDQIAEARKYSIVTRAFTKTQTYHKILDTIRDCYEISKYRELENRIDKLFSKLRFSIKNKGTNYLKEAIIIAVYNENNEMKLNDITETIAKKNMAVASRVYWNINDTLKSMWKSCDRKLASRILNVTDNTKPSPEYVVEYLSRYYKKTL